MEMSEIVEFFQGEFLGIEIWVYFASLGTILLGFVAKRIAALIFSRLEAVAAKSKMPFDDILLHALSRPVEWGVVIGGVYLAISLLPLPREPVDIARFVQAALTAASVALIVWVATRMVDGVTEWWKEKAAQTESKLDDQLVPIVSRSFKVFFYIIGVVLVLQNLGYSVGSLLAGLGIGGLAIAMASKDTVANLFGSLVIFLDKPFQIGDWVEMGDVEGTVEEVGLRTTRIRTFANSLITVPNAMFTTREVNNWSQMQKRRIMMTVGLTYSSSPEKVEQLVGRIREIIESDENIRNDFYLVNFDSFGAYSLDVFVYCFTHTTVWGEFLQAKQELMLQIMRAVEDLGLGFAFPTQSLHLESMPGEPPAMTSQRPS